MNDTHGTALDMDGARPAPAASTASTSPAAPAGRTGVTDVPETPFGAPAPPPESPAGGESPAGVAAGSAAGPDAESHSHRIRRRALTLLLIVALIGVPAGYLIISADQSRDAGKDHEAKTRATGLVAGVPSKVQRRLYNVPVPAQHAAAMSYETNNWRTSRLYVQFLTTPKGLNGFLTAMGVDPGALRKGDVPISARDRGVAGWDFSGTGDWRGFVHRSPAPRPTQRVVVNYANPRYPQVYVVSSTTP